MRSANWRQYLSPPCIIVPQLVVALISPWVGRRADSWGRRPLLLLGFGALPLRCLLFAFASDPRPRRLEQILDGLSAAVLGVLVPLIISDIAQETGRFNFAQGVVGTAVGIGAALSTSFAGYISDQYSNRVAFLDLAAIATCGVFFVLIIMPETRPPLVAIGSQPWHRRYRLCQLSVDIEIVRWPCGAPQSLLEIFANSWA